MMRSIHRYRERETEKNPGIVKGTKSIKSNKIIPSCTDRKAHSTAKPYENPHKENLVPEKKNEKIKNNN